MSEEFIIPFLVFLGSLVYATFGFGDAIFAMPFLTLLVDVKIATPLMTLNGITLAILLFYKNYKLIDWKVTKKLVGAAIFGIPIGIYFLKYGNEQIIKTVLYIFILIVAFYNLFFTQIKINLPNYFSYLFGFLGGILGGAFNTAGPPIVIFGILKNWTALQFIANLQGYFLVADVFIIIGQLATSLINKTILFYYLCSLPFTLLALYIGTNIRKKLSEDNYKKYVYLLLLFVGCYGLIRLYLLT